MCSSDLLYLRNVKQILRAAQPPFDERAYGYANLTDLLRAAGKDGLVRVDRDRQGVIRVFQGNLAVPVAESPVAEVVDVAAEPVANAVEIVEAATGEGSIVVDGGHEDGVGGLAHPALVVADGVDDVVVLGKGVEQQSCIVQGRVGAHAERGQHGMRRIADERDAAR